MARACARRGRLGIHFEAGRGDVSAGALVGALSALLSAIAQVGVRGLTRSEPVRRIVFYFTGFSTGIALVPASLQWVTPRLGLLPLLGLLGLCAILGQLLLTRAYSLAPAVRVGPFMYSAVVFAALLDWLLFRKVPDALTWAGATCVVAAGVLALRLRMAPADGAARTLDALGSER